MTTTNTEAPADADIACPECGSTGPFEAEVFEIYAGSGGRVARVGSDGNADWEWEPTEWDPCDGYDQSKFECVAARVSSSS